MNGPTLTTRMLGRPRVAAALYIGCALAVLGWFGGEIPWWLALMAIATIGSVRKAGRKLRQYEEWWAAWDGMGSAPGAAPPKATTRASKPSSSRLGIAVAALSLAIIPLLLPMGDATFRRWLALLWLGVAVYLARKLASGRRARVRKAVAGTAGGGAGNDGRGDDVVKWALPRAPSSPSRADALRQLPDYCARLMEVERRRESA